MFASLCAHALALLAFPLLLEPARSRTPPPAPIVARLVQPPPKAEPPPPVAVPVQAKAAEPVRTPARPQPAPQPVLSVPSPLASTTVAPAPVEPARAAEPVPAVTAPAAVPAPAARTEAATAPAPVADSLDPQTLGQYRVAIIAAARRFKRYPRIALDNNWEGKAEIRLVIGADGNIASISIRGRSGFEVLDQQALEMIRRAKGQEPVPPALRGRTFTLDVPVVFSLKEE